MERLGTVTIVGVGLIGGSIGLALRARGLADRIVGVGRSEQSLSEAESLGIIDESSTDLPQAVARADVAVICTPVTRIAIDVRQAAAFGPDHLLVTDAGSTKTQIVASVEADPRSREKFVGAHPIAGSERKGPSHARADLFEGRSCVLTPTSNTNPDRLRRARAFWNHLGGRILEMTPEAHDEALACTSHLPHVLASALAGMVPVELLPLAAGAYRAVTRVAASDAALWAGIFLGNREPILRSLQAFETQLDEFKHALQAGDEAAIRSWWEAARNRRILFDHEPNSPEALAQTSWKTIDRTNAET